MRTPMIPASFAVLCLLAACDRATSAKSPATMSPAELAAEQERCKQLGLKVYDDAACQAAQAEDRSRFLGTSREPVK